jgi:uncharacterized protein (TIGR03435 family)
MAVRRTFLLTTTATLALANFCARAQTAPAPQAATGTAQPAAAAGMPAWQKAAGGTMEFDVASVRQDTSGVFKPPSFALSADDGSPPPEGLFRADFPLMVYIEFAYKIWPSREQVDAMLAPLPKWVTTDRFLIEARYPNSKPTKDQVRLMMQALLAERFGMKLHVETQTIPVLAMTLVKPDKPGPKLQPHVDSPECNDPIPLGAPPPEGSKRTFPFGCGTYELHSLPDHSMELGARHTTMSLLASSLPSIGALGRPVVDRTGLTGRFDFTVAFSQEATMAANRATTGAEAQPETQGPTFLEAVQDQLGLKLERTTAPMPTLIIDHIERPSEN